jgi:hypothetical protein
MLGGGRNRNGVVRELILAELEQSNPVTRHYTAEYDPSSIRSRYLAHKPSITEWFYHRAADMKAGTEAYQASFPRCM